MPRRRLIAAAFVLAACSAPEPSGPPPEALQAQLQELAEMTGESVEALSKDPCIVGCTGAAYAGCDGVHEICATSFAAPFAGAWITCTEAELAACGSSAGLYQCALSCRDRAGQS